MAGTTLRSTLCEPAYSLFAATASRDIDIIGTVLTEPASAPRICGAPMFARAPNNPLGTISSTDFDGTKKSPPVCHHR